MPVVRNPHAEPTSVFDMSLLDIAVCSYDIFRGELSPEIGRILREACSAQGTDVAADEPLPVRFAERLREAIIDSTASMSPEFGPIVAEAARKGYWLQVPQFPGWEVTVYALERLSIKPIDRLRPEDCLARPRTLRQAGAWISKAPAYEFEGDRRTAHEHRKSQAARKRCPESSDVRV